MTQKNSPLANAILREAIKKTQEADHGTDEYEAALVKLGVVLHTYADTWSHAGFSGRHSSAENDIDNIRI